MKASLHFSVRYWGLPFALHFERANDWHERTLSLSFLCFGLVISWRAA